MTLDSRQIVITALMTLGLNDALKLRERAVSGEITDNEVLYCEHAVPAWRADKDYTNAAVGTPVAHEGQVYGLIQPHNAANYPDTTPATLPALWRVKHATDPEVAKPFVKPTSTSDMYLTGECMIWTDGVVKRAKRDTIYSPDEYAADWEDAEV